MSFELFCQSRIDKGKEQQYNNYANNSIQLIYMVPTNNKSHLKGLQVSKFNAVQLGTVQINLIHFKLINIQSFAYVAERQIRW